VGAVITFRWIVAYIQSAYARLFGFGLLGLAIGAAIYFFSPKYYEASFILKMPTANGLSSTGEIEKHIIKSVPPALDAKKLLLRPEDFPVNILMACGFEDRNKDRKKLVNSLIVHEVNYGLAVQVAIRIPGREIISKCSQAILIYQTEYVNAQKDGYVRYVRDANKSTNSQMIVNEPAQLTAPIRISDGVVYPRLSHLLLGCLIMGLLLSCLIDWVRYLWSRAR
jgi:hypothetical protein